MSQLWEDSKQSHLLREDAMQPAGNMVRPDEVHNLMKMLEDELVLHQSSQLPTVQSKPIANQTRITTPARVTAK